MTADDEKALAALAASGVRIPPQPKVVIEMQRLLASDDYDMRKVAHIVAQDPGIVAMLFKVARSPVFKRATAPTTLDQVLMTVGVKQTFNLVQAAALSAGVSDGQRKGFDTFWTRAQEIGQLAALIAGDRIKICKVPADQAYMAGIFHECGVPVLMLRDPDYCKTLSLDNACCCPDLQGEDKRLNVDHVTVGYLVARHWHLPDFVCAAIRSHNDLPTEDEGSVVSLVAILQLATHFYHRMNQHADPLWQDIGERVLSELCIAPDDESDFFDQIANSFLAENG